MSHTQISLTNDYVNPSVLVIGMLTDTTQQFSKNFYFDTKSKTKYTDELEPVCRGNVYDFVIRKNDSVYVVCPFKVMDKELYQLVYNLKSFRCVGKTIQLLKEPAANSRNIKSCIQEFTLSWSDFQAFRVRGAKFGFIFRNNAISTTELIDSTKRVIEFCTDILLSIKAAVTLIPSLTSEDELHTFLNNLKRIEGLTSKAKDDRKAVVKSFVKLSNEEGRHSDTALVEAALSKIDDVYEELIGIDMYKLCQQAAHVVAVKGGKKESMKYVRSLEQEIALLAVHYPVLARLTVTDEAISFGVPGCDIKLTKGTTIIKGELSSLEPFLLANIMKGRPSES